MIVEEFHLNIIKKKIKDQKNLDFSTFQLYYSNEILEKINQKIKKIFREKFSFSFSEIKSSIKFEFTEFDLLSALYKLIQDNIPIKNSLGFSSYLREQNNIYFLVDSLSIPSVSSLSFYTKFPCIKEKLNFSDLQKKYYYQIAIPKIIKNICEDEKESLRQIERLPPEVKELFIEAAISLEEKKNKGQEFLPRQKLLSSIIIKKYKSEIRKLKDLTISVYLSNFGKPIRCLEAGTDKWKDCDSNLIKILENQKIAQRKALEKHDFYGQINPLNKRFCIRDLREGIEKKGNQLTSGKQCNPSCSKAELSYISVFETDMAVPPSLKTLTYIKTGECGPDIDLVSGKQKNFGLQIDDGWTERLKDIKTKEKKVKNRLKIFNLKDEKLIREFLLFSAKRFFKSIKKNIPPYQRSWFDSKAPIYEKLVEIGGGKEKDSKKEKEKALIEGIYGLTLAEMQRLIFYGSLMKKSRCLFLCEWFKSNNLLIENKECGFGKKKKPLIKQKSLKIKSSKK